MGHTDNFLKRSRHQPTTMNVNTSYHCESPKSDRKFTSLIALSNGSTTFGTATTGNSPDPDQHATDIRKSDMPVTLFPGDSQKTNIDNMDLTHTTTDVHDNPNQATSPQKSAGRARKYLPYLAATALVIGLAATALTVLSNKEQKGRSINRPEKNTSKKIDDEKKTVTVTTPDDEGAAVRMTQGSNAGADEQSMTKKNLGTVKVEAGSAKVPPPPGAGDNEDAGTKGSKCEVEDKGLEFVVKECCENCCKCQLEGENVAPSYLKTAGKLAGGVGLGCAAAYAAYSYFTGTTGEGSTGEQFQENKSPYLYALPPALRPFLPMPRPSRR